MAYKFYISIFKTNKQNNTHVESQTTIYTNLNSR